VKIRSDVVGPRDRPRADAGQLSKVALRRLLDRIDAISGEHDDWSRESRWPPLQIVPAQRRPQRALFVTKPNGLMGIDPEQLPSSVTFLSRYGIAGAEMVERIAAECPTKELAFVGDLDPLDLTVFLVLASRLGPYGVRVQHLVVGGAWIERCRRNSKGRPGLPVIKMSAFETRVFDLLKTVPVPWKALVGGEALELLDGGEKLELEGATNPAIYLPALTRELQGDLFGISSASLGPRTA
jgi:hypothetical protein